MPSVIENIGKRIYSYGRNNDGTPYVKEEDFIPYFYIPDPEGNFKSIFGDKVKKIIALNPQDIPSLRSKYPKTFEANVLFTNRYLIDKFDDVIPEESLRLCYLDIETEIINSFPNPKNPEERISCIGCFDNFINKYNIFAIKNNDLIINNDEETNYHFFDNEIDLLKKFITYIKNTNPDILIAWNGDGFDFLYIINRMKKLSVDTKELARIKNCFVDKDRAFIPGRILFDLMWAYKWLIKKEQESFKLDNIGELELGKKKISYKGTLQELFENDFKRFLEYNKRDVELLKLLNEKLMITKFFDASRRMARCHFNEVFRISALGDALLLKYSKGKYCLPTEKFQESEEKIPGAFVWDSKPGLYQNVAGFDWRSLYPNIIITFNLSLEKLKKSQGFNDNLIMIKNDILPTTFFFEKDKGLLPTIISDLLKQRIAYKKKMNEFKYGSKDYETYYHLQYAAKIFANAMFGALKSFSRMSHPYYIASAITTMARTINRKVASFIEEEGFKVIYGDTDSVYTLMENHSIEEMQSLRDKVNNKINEWIKKEFNVDESTLVLEFESVFKSILFCKSSGSDKGSKKRYAYWKVWEDGKEVDEIGVKGFEERRSDSPRYVRQFQKKLFELVLKDSKKDVVESFVENITKEFYSLREEIAIPVGLSNELHNYGNIPQIRAIRHSNRFHKTNFNKGDKIKWVYLKSSPQCFPQTDVMCLINDKLPEGYEIDYNKMFDRLIKNKIEIVFDSIGWGNKGIQKSLGDF